SSTFTGSAGGKFPPSLEEEVGLVARCLDFRFPFLPAGEVRVEEDPPFFLPPVVFFVFFLEGEGIGPAVDLLRPPG
ncbi:hypothetical protein ACDT16_13700, partial [Staphylococcus aureus]